MLSPLLQCHCMLQKRSLSFGDLPLLEDKRSLHGFSNS